jgi:membrane-bound lytic murein transglycosylase MltF
MHVTWSLTSLATLAVMLLAATLVASGAYAQEKKLAETPRQLSLERKPWKGDFDAMLERRLIRVLIPYSRTLYFNDKGRERGITAENVRDFEHYLNKKYAKLLGKRPLTVYIIPTTRDKLIPELNDGLGDIAAGNLTVTEARLTQVDFAAPKDRKPVREFIVTGPRSPEVKTLDDLSGQTIHVRPATSYAESVAALNERFKAAGKAPVTVAALPDALEDEDTLEMLNAGLFELAVVDDWKGRMWAQVLPKITVREDLVLRSEGVIGWAIRKDSPKLEAAILDFYANYLKKQGVIDYRLAQFHKRVKQIHNNADREELTRFEATIDLFRRYGAQYGFDPVMLAAQGYQESQLRQEAKSHVGAIGVMQLMPPTGNQMRVGDIRSLEPNIHAGAKYMDQLMTRYFPDVPFTETNRTLFAFAAYNAGPGNLAKIRKEAETRGLDPNGWFNNVEIVTAERIGIETTTYVRNIYKYYAAYKLTQEAQAAQRKAREQVAPSTP